MAMATVSRSYAAPPILLTVWLHPCEPQSAAIIATACATPVRSRNGVVTHRKTTTKSPILDHLLTVLPPTTTLIGRQTAKMLLHRPT